METVRRLELGDFEQLVAVYRDAVISQAKGLYTRQQIGAWADHAGRDDGFREALGRGYGLVSCADPERCIIEAFALLDPIDRLALLYCRGRASRQGRATTLLRLLESEARRHACPRLRTEASQLSRPLLERQGWRVDREEEVIFAATSFLRWRMIKDLL